MHQQLYNTDAIKQILGTIYLLQVQIHLKDTLKRSSIDKNIQKVYTPVKYSCFFQDITKIYV